MRISNFSSMCHFFLISRGRARHFHLIPVFTSDTSPFVACIPEKYLAKIEPSVFNNFGLQI